jgi:ABC-type amino acid transport substrate-binding protein
MRRGAARWWIAGSTAGQIGLALLQAAPAGAEPEFTIYYHERAPYSTKQPDGSVRGVLADITDEIMKTAGIAFRWRDLPSARQIEVIKRNDAPACAIGWFKRPDREAFAKFTAPIYHDPPTVVVARADDGRFAGTPTIDTLFHDKSLLLLIKTGYSYGAEIDAKMASEAPNLRRDPSDNRAMVVMLSRKRVDYMIMAEEEAKVLLADPELGKGIAIYHLGSAPPGELRYLMCSRAVPDALIARINQAIQPPQ